jgi:hypothetical protein
LRACAHGDARVRDLVAELLWFHQRSQKPGWWALFERQAWSENELVDDAESLGGLRLDKSSRQNNGYRLAARTAAAQSSVAPRERSSVVTSTM